MAVVIPGLSQGSVGDASWPGALRSPLCISGLRLRAWLVTCPCDPCSGLVPVGVLEGHGELDCADMRRKGGVLDFPPLFSYFHS